MSFSAGHTKKSVEKTRHRLVLFFDVYS